MRRTWSRPASPISSARTGLREQLGGAGGRVFDGVDEVAVLAVANLHRDPAAAPADHRPALPQCLAHGEPESFAQRLLHHDVGGTLERVDLHRADLLDVRDEVDVRVAGARRVGQLPVVEALGVVGGHRAREHELRVRELLADDAERLDHADRVLPRVEPADLHDERIAAARTPYCRTISSTNGRGISRFFTESGSMHGGANTARSCGMPSGTNSGIVHTDASYCSTNALEELPHLRVGVGEVDVAAPDPLGVLVRDARVARVVEHRGGLRVVHHDVVPLAFELQRVVEHPLEVDAFHLAVPLDVGALQRVVDVLGDGEELVAAVDDLPLGLDPEVAQQGNVGREQLGDAAAVRGRVHVEHPGAAQRRGQLPDPLEGPGLDGVLVVVEMLVEQRHTFEQRISWRRQRPGKRSIYVTCPDCPDPSPVPLRVPTSSGERCGPTRPRPRSRPGSGGPDSTTWSRCRWPTAARARSTRLLAARGGSRRVARVTGPLGDPVDAEWGVLPSGIAVIEMAQASGLALVSGRNDPLRASTRGTGELIAAARREGFKRVLVAVGGSATTDGGLAAVEALGWSLQGIEVTVACDVESAFLDAARIYGPQKGASDAQVALLDAPAQARRRPVPHAHRRRRGGDRGRRRGRRSRGRSRRDRRAARARLRRGRGSGRARRRVRGRGRSP